jgi:hypothetical protein
MILCTDFWTSECGGGDVAYNSFVSALPHNQRMGTGQLHNIVSNDFITSNTTETVYSFGTTLAGSFGKGDSVSGRNKMYINSIDVETGLEIGGNINDSQRLGALVKGSADAIQGYAYYLYVISLFTYGNAVIGRYPNPDGSFNSIITTDSPDINYAISNVWKSPININGESIMLSETKNIREIEEIAHYAEDSFEQGYVLRNSGGTALRTINHFGTVRDESGVSGWNVDHVPSRSVCIVETGVAYANTQNRDYVSMFKITCDRGSTYIWTDHTDVISGAPTYWNLNRNTAFCTAMLIFLSGAKGWHIWGSANSFGANADGYNGMLGALQYIYKDYIINSNTISLASLRPNLSFNKWNSEQSYDGGSTWVKHKAIEWKNSTNYIPLRTAYTNSGYITIFACRPYGVEPLSCKWRVNISGTSYTGDITSNDWMSCYPVESPNRKDFYFKILKV